MQNVLTALLLILTFILAACGSTQAPTEPPTRPPATLLATTAPTITVPPSVTVPAPTPAGPMLTPVESSSFGSIGRVYRQAHYCTDGDTALRMDIFVPNELNNDPAPAVINTGIRLDELGELLKRGYIVAQLLWREPPDFKLPIGVHDTKCAVRYLRAHASDYHIDPDHIGAWGCSRGGHMAALVGVSGGDAGMEGASGFENESSRLQAIVMMDGIANFRTNYADDLSELESVHGITSFDDPLVARFSPVTYASSDDPPFLIMAADGDSGHWVRQAQELNDALKAKGVETTLVIVENSPHCFTPPNPNMKPSSKEIIQIVANFFDQKLK